MCTDITLTDVKREDKTTCSHKFNRCFIVYVFEIVKRYYSAVLPLFLPIMNTNILLKTIKVKQLIGSNVPLC